MRPHPNDFYCLLADVFLVRRRSLKGIEFENVEEAFGFGLQST